MIARRLRRGNRKYKGKLPIIYFSCNKVGHIVARCLDKEDKDERRDNKYKGKRDEIDKKKVQGLQRQRLEIMLYC